MENPDTKKDEVKAYRLSEYGFDDPFRPKNLRHLGLKMIEHYTDSYDIITSREVNKMFLVVHERILKKLDTEDFTFELANDEDNGLIIDEYENQVHLYNEYIREILYSVNIFSKLNDDEGIKNLTLYIKLPTQFAFGVPKEWNHLTYSPVNINEIKSLFAKYKSNEMYSHPILDHFFLKIFLYDQYSTSYFNLIFKKYINKTPWSEVVTNGSLIQMYIYRLVSPAIKILFNFVLPISIIYFLYRNGYELAPFILSILYALYVIFIPINIYRNWKTYKPFKEKIGNVCQRSLETYLDIVKGSFNPKQIKLMMTNDGKDPSLFVTTEIYTIVDGMIKEHNDYFTVETD